MPVTLDVEGPNYAAGEGTARRKHEETVGGRRRWGILPTTEPGSSTPEKRGDTAGGFLTRLFRRERE